MVDEVDIDEGAGDSALIGPGCQLKSLRLKQDLTLEDIFHQTRIPLNKLRQLEAESFEELGASVYVLGYVRAYAKALTIDPEPLIELYQQAHANQVEFNQANDTMLSQNAMHASVSETVEKSASIRPTVTRTQAPGSPKTPVYAGIAFCFLVIAVVLVVSNGGKPAEASGEDAVVIPAVVGEAPSEGENSDGAPVLVEHTESELALNGGLESDSSTETLGADVVATLTEEIEAVSLNPGVNTAGSLDNERAVSTDAIESRASTTDIKPVDLDGEHSELTLAFTEECWIEVKDANNEIVFADLQNSGDNLRLFGLAPFEIMLGNARGVEFLSIDGEPVELNIQGTRKTLRLSVEQP